MFKSKRFKLDWIVYMVIGLILIVFGVLFLLDYMLKIDSLPFDKWLEDALRFIAGFLIIFFVVVFCVPKLKEKSNFALKVLLYIELGIDILISLLLFIPSLDKNIHISYALSIPLYAYGFVEIVRGYYSLGDINRNLKIDKYIKFINLGLITLATYIFTSKVITTSRCIYTISIAIIVIGAYFFIQGVLYKKYPELNTKIDDEDEKETQEKLPDKKQNKKLEDKTTTSNVVNKETATNHLENNTNNTSTEATNTLDTSNTKEETNTEDINE